MGLITSLLTLPLAPVRGVAAVAEQVLQQAEETYYDPALIRGQLQEIDRLREAGEIDDETATAWEDQLVERLMVGLERRGHG
jgi:hypothetical protein